MTDAGMIAWLRGERSAFEKPYDGDAISRMREIADRLEALARPRPSGDAPVSEERLGQIRSNHALVMPGGQALPGLDGYQAESRAAFVDRRDLLAAFDHERARADDAERWCVACTDADGYRAGVAAGVAKALAAVRAYADEYEGRSGSDYRHQRAAFARDAAAAVEKQLKAAADLPPHEATLARLRMLEAAARALLEHLPLDLGAGLREALEGRWA